MKNRQRNRLDATESSKNLSELCALITLWAVAKCPFFSRLFGDLTKVFMPSHSWRSARNYRNHLHRQTGYHIHVNNNGEFRNIHYQSPSFGHIGRLKTRVYNKIK